MENENENIRRLKEPSKLSSKRRFCIFLALLMIFGSVVPVTAALPVSAANPDAEARSRIAAVKEILGAASYAEYIRANTELYANEHGGKLPYAPAGAEIIIDIGNYEIDDVLKKYAAEGNKEKSVASPTDLGKPMAIYLPDEGAVTFKFNVKDEGLYNLGFTYRQVVGKTSSIERMVKINGKVPFKEARYITLTKTYTDDYYYIDKNDGDTVKPANEIAGFDPADAERAFQKDIKKNQIKPTKREAPEWRTVLAEDSAGFVDEPLMFYLKAGENTLTLEAVREAVYISELKFYKKAELLTYEQYKSEMVSKYGDKKGAIDKDIKIQAEMPEAASEIVIYALNDRTSAITEPQDASRKMLNAIGGIRWQSYGQWIRYEFDVPSGGDGFYQIVPRFKQSTYSGVYSSRRIRLDGEVPFKEANSLRFNYSADWQTLPLNNGTLLEGGKKREVKPFEFYLTAGKHVIEFEVVLGDMAEILGRVEASLAHLNEMYRKIRMITGATPDQYRDYQFAKRIPTVLDGMWDESQNLTEISKLLEETIGGKGEHTATLDKVALQLERMAKDNDKIAPGMDLFKTNIGALATWLLERRNQPLDLDYIQIHRPEEKLPPAEANFFESVGFEFMSFIMSFISDYNSEGAMEEIDDTSKVVEVWMGSSAPVMGGLSLAGRDQAQIVRQMVVDFTKDTTIQVNLKLVAANSLLPSVLAGVGPDVAVANNGGDAINYAIRSAVLPLNYYKDGKEVEYTKGNGDNIKSFDEVRKYFMPSALTPLTLQNSKTEDQNLLSVYGLPETQTFPMMFYRKDIFAELNIEPPKTWDDMYAISPTLQTNNMEVGWLPGMTPLMTFMFQKNVPLYVDDGIEINLGHNDALNSMLEMTNLYTQYKFPIQFDFANRFRAGDMPLSIQSYDLYNQLMVFAPEIRGLWEFVTLPGTVRKYDEKFDKGVNYEKFNGYVSENGEVEQGWIIDPTSPAGVVCTLMMKSAKDKDNMNNAWAFMQWWVSAKTQGDFGNEIVAVMGAAAKYPTANLQALTNMPWPTADLNNLLAQFEYLKAVPEVPGSYIVTRNVDFVWKDAYNNGTNAVELIQDYNIEINKELTRKRSEFGMEVIARDRNGRRLDADSVNLD